MTEVRIEILPLKSSKAVTPNAVADAAAMNASIQKILRATASQNLDFDASINSYDGQNVRLEEALAEVYNTTGKARSEGKVVVRVDNIQAANFPLTAENVKHMKAALEAVAQKQLTGHYSAQDVAKDLVCALPAQPSPGYQSRTGFSCLK